MGDTSFTVVKSSNILDYAKTLPFGWHFFRGASETPGNPTATASAMVIAYVITASRDISLLAYVHGNKAFLNTCSSGTWSGWEELATRSDLGGLVVTEASSINQIDATGSGTDSPLRIMYFLEEVSGSHTTAYISIDVYWIRFQFKTSNATTLQQRLIYGQSAGTWRTLVLN